MEALTTSNPPSGGGFSSQLVCFWTLEERVSAVFFIRILLYEN